MFHRRAMMGFVGFLAIAFASQAEAQTAKTKQTVVPASEARNHVGKNVTIEFAVKHTKNSEKQMMYYIDSETDFSDEKNVAVMIAYKHEAAFKAADIDDPCLHYRDKTIRVSGKVLKEGEFIRIRVENPKSIKIVEAK